MKSRTPAQSGSILFYILIGIVLFAALSFTMSRINRGGSNFAGAEQLGLRAGEILDYARSLRTAAQTLQAAGIPDTLISFENPQEAGYTNASCAKDSCKIFERGGGGLSYTDPLVMWLDESRSASPNFGHWLFSGLNAVTDIGTDGAGNSSVELLAILPWIKKDLCVKLNDLLGVTNPGGDPPQDPGTAEVSGKFTGAYSLSRTIGGAAEIDGQRAACFEGGGAPPAGTYHFFQVLLAR